MNYDPNCVRCRMMRPGTTESHNDHRDTHRVCAVCGGPNGTMTLHDGRGNYYCSEAHYEQARP